MLSNCGVGEDSWESLVLQGDPTSPKSTRIGQPWIFIGRTDAEAEAPILWTPDAKSWLIGKVSDAGRDWGQEEKGTTEDEMAGWHHWLNVLESGWTPGVCDGQGGLACCDSWGRKESDTTERLNWTELNWTELSNMSIAIPAFLSFLFALNICFHALTFNLCVSLALKCASYKQHIVDFFF